MLASCRAAWSKHRIMHSSAATIQQINCAMGLICSWSSEHGGRSGGLGWLLELDSSICEGLVEMWIATIPSLPSLTFVSDSHAPHCRRGSDEAAAGGWGKEGEEPDASDRLKILAVACMDVEEWGKDHGADIDCRPLWRACSNAVQT